MADRTQKPHATHLEITIATRSLKHVPGTNQGMSRPMLNFGAVHCLVSDYATFAG